MPSIRNYATAATSAFSLGVTGYIFGSLIAFAALTAGSLTEPPLFSSSFSKNLLSIIALQGLGIPLTALTYLKLTNKPLSYVKPTRPSLTVLKFSAYGILVLIGAQIIIGNIFMYFNTPTATSAITTSPNAELPLYALLSILIVAPAEELLFRGVIQTRLRETYSKLPSIVIAAFIFSLPHWSALLGDSGRYTSLFVIFVLGMLLGWMYERTNTLTVPIIVHGVFNAFVFGVNLL